MGLGRDGGGLDPGRRVEPAGGGWFERTVTARFLAARETLRSTRTFGPLINELYPVEVFDGEMEALPASP